MGAAISSLDPNIFGDRWETRCAEMRIEREGVPHPGLPHQGETCRIHEAKGVLGETLQYRVGLLLQMLGHDYALQLVAVRQGVEKLFRLPISLGDTQQRVGFSDHEVRSHERTASFQNH